MRKRIQTATDRDFFGRAVLPTKADSHHLHDLRHTFVTLSLDAGASLRDVQDAAGHADPRTTRRYDRARQNLDKHLHTYWRVSSDPYTVAFLILLPGCTVVAQGATVQRVRQSEG
jgi:integrase